MELSNFYTDNIFQLKYNNIFNSNKLTIPTSWDLRTIGNNKDYDNSNIYTMCIDSDINKYSVIEDLSENINHIQLRTTNKTSSKNAITFIASTGGLTDISTSRALSFMPKNTYKDNRTYSSSNYNNLNELVISKVYVYPIIFAINKNDFNTEHFVNRSVPIDATKIKQITLAELYNNTDKYYITAYQQRLIYINNVNETYDLGTTTPCKYTYFDDTHFAMSSIANIGINYAIQQVPIKYHGFWYSESGIGVTSAPCGFPLECRLTSYDSNTDNILPCFVNSFDFVPTFNNETKYINSNYDSWKLCSFTENGLKRTCGIHVYSTEYIMKLIASQGLFIAWNGFYNSSVSLLDSSDIAVGEMNRDGFTTGKIITPYEKTDSNSPNLHYSNYTDSTADPNNYVPVTPIPTDDNITEPDYRITDQIGGFTMYYKVNQSDLLSIVQRVNFPSSEYPLPEGWEFAPHLVSCTQYPFNVSQYVIGHNSHVIIGSWDSGVDSISLTSTQLAVQIIANFTIEHKFNNFLDYSPYAQYQLYVPLCGWVDLPDICVGKNIAVELATDVINNSCVATVKADGCPIVSKVGHMGSSVALSVTENGLKQAALTQSLFSTLGAVTSTGYAVATQNAIGIVNGVASVAGSIAQGNIANNSNYTRQIGSTSDKSDFHVSNTCYLKISYTQPDEPDNYAHSVGYPCNESGNIESFSGYTVCSDVDTSGLSCNQNQRDTIKRILETGFYI